VIYTIWTNRPDWAEFAFEQFKKAEKAVGCILIVIDNSENGIEFYKDKCAEYFHVPQCENVGAMFNWFLDNYDSKDHDLFYMDDDIWIYPETLPEMAKYLKMGFDCVKLTRVGVTDLKTGNKDTWTRRSRNVGAAWLASRDLWRSQRFDSLPRNSFCMYWVRMGDYNCKFIHKVLADYMIHNKNVALSSNCTFDHGKLVK